MKRSSALLISMVLNAILLGVVLWQRTAGPAPTPVEKPHAEAPLRHQIKAKTEAGPGASPSAFDWKSVESEDYKVYIRQLRGVGCPEETIRDIIAADVRKLYEAKRAELRPVSRAKYWQAGFAAGGKTDPQQQARYEALEREEKQVLKELLGPSGDQAYRPYAAAAEEGALDLEDMSEGSREKVRVITKKYAQLEADIESRSLSGVLSVEDEVRLVELREQRRRELASLLSPAEFEQFEVRNSETAAALRSSLVGVELTEEEFLKVFRAQRQLAELNESVTDPFDPRLLQTEKEVEEKTKALLGEKRYGELKRGNDPDYRDLQQLAKGYGVSGDTVLKVYDLQKQLEQAREALDKNTNVTPQERQRTLTELQREAGGSIRSLIGDKAFEVYQRRFGVQ